MDRYGRKKIVLISDVLYFIGGLLMVLAPVMNILIMSRLMIGVATGITSLNVPIYITEVLPTEMRGRVIAIYTFLVVFGTFMANIIILLMPESKNYDWRILEAICLLAIVAQFLGVYYLPESPRWLANNGKQDEANMCIKQVYKTQF